MTGFDWHSEPITADTPVTETYRNTQNVRRFLRANCGPTFKFDRRFMQWIKDGTRKTMGEVAKEWLKHRREESSGDASPGPTTRRSPNASR